MLFNWIFQLSLSKEEDFFDQSARMCLKLSNSQIYYRQLCALLTEGQSVPSISKNSVMFILWKE